MQNNEEQNIPIVKVDFDRKDTDKNQKYQDPANFYNFNYPSELKPGKVVNEDQMHPYYDKPGKMPPPNHFNPGLNQFYNSNNGPQHNDSEHSIFVRDNIQPNNNQNRQNTGGGSGFFGKMATNFQDLPRKQFITMIALLVFSLCIWSICFYFFFIKMMLPKLTDFTEFKFACAKGSFFSEDRTELCFIGVGQMSFGIISIGQLAFGIFTFGQVSVGFFSIGQGAVGFIYCFVGQVCVAAINWANQLGVCVLYSKLAMIATSPLRPLIEKNKPPVVCMCN